MHTKNVVGSLILLLLNAVSQSAAASPASDSLKPRLEHTAVWVKDVDKTSNFLSYALGWRRHPLKFGVAADSRVYGGMKLAFVDANGLWLELVEPTSPGPGMDFLKQKGNGSLVELDFFVDDFDTAEAAVRTMGIQPMGMDGKPMVNGGRLTEWAIKDGKRVRGDERLLYMPMDVSRGTSVEIGWEYPSGVVLLRDATWKEGERTPRSGPRVDHVVVLAQDLEKTAKFYTDVLGLRRNPRSSGFPRRWMGLGADRHAWIDGGDGTWIELVSPAPGSAAAKLLENPRFGDGAILELDVEVPDADTFYDRMRAKGLTMTAGDSTALAAGEKSVVLPTGDRFSYFPQSASQGMRIMVFQRGSAASSLLPEPRELRRSGGTQGS
jgi:catechol 2,3-dioxygenase-like lactoylglutathione lyase family enzyme